MKKVHSATFLEPAIFGFKNVNGKPMPFSQRISQDELQRKNQFDLLQLQMQTGLVTSADIKAGYIQISQEDKISGELDRNLSPDLRGIFQFQNAAELADFKTGDEVSVYEIKKDDKTFHVLGK